MSELRAALEQAIAADPDDLAAHAAYADLLVEEGDPRGEFIQVQLALEAPSCKGKHRKTLQQREQEVLDAHQADWLGPLAPAVLDRRAGNYQRSSQPAARVTWARGWLESLYLWWLEIESARTLVGCPAARILRKLDLHHVQWYEEGEAADEIRPEDNIPPDEDFTALYGLVNAPFLPHLRWLRVGEEVDFDDDTYNSEAFGQGLVEVLQRTAALEELYVLAKGTDLDRLFDLRNLTRLRTLLVYHHTDPYPLEVLAANPALPRLETLRLHPASNPDDDEAFLGRDAVTALLLSRHFPALRNLHLHASDLGDPGCVEIVKSGILKRLKVLDLRHGCIGDEGARALARCKDVRRLELLSLADNELTEAGCELLRGLGINVRLDNQHDPGSNQYLWSGDME
jgi:uncharacterized protein (TIGR02996 family)